MENDARGHQKRENRAPGSPKVSPRHQKWAKGHQKWAKSEPKVSQNMIRDWGLMSHLWSQLEANYDPKFGTNMSQSWLISEPKVSQNRWSWILEIRKCGSFMSQLWLKTLWSTIWENFFWLIIENLWKKKNSTRQDHKWAKVSQKWAKIDDPDPDPSLSHHLCKIWFYTDFLKENRYFKKPLL